jgi:thioredoxin 1
MKPMTVWMLTLVAALAALAALPALAEEKPQRVAEAHPGLTPGALAYAALGELPDGILLKSGTVQVSAKELQAELDKAPEPLRDQMQKNLPVILEQMVTGRLLLETARKSAAEKKEDVSKKSDNDILLAYLDPVVNAVKVTKEEVKEFYDKNLALCGGTPFEKMKGELEAYVLQQKKEAAVAAYIRTLGQRMDITVSAAWIEKQVPLSKDNPVDKARSGGKPAFVDFGGKSCCGPDNMLPVVKAIEGKFKDKLNVLYVEAKDYQIVAARYGIGSIPAQILFDKDGKEVFRHDGLMSEAEVAEQLRAVGVK